MLDFSVTFIISIINITVLFLILRAILFKPVTKFMAEREKRIQNSIEQSEKDKNQAKTLLAQYETQLKTAESEAETILRNARENAQQEAERIIAESRVKAEETLTNARKQLEAERQAAFALFRRDAAILVVAAAQRLIGREMKINDNRQYAEMLLREISFQNDVMAQKEPPPRNEGKN
jgi:F-type H+-transporting ATPase subunit b